MRVRCKTSYFIMTDTNDRNKLSSIHDDNLSNSYIKLVFEKDSYYELLDKKEGINNCYTISTPLHHENIILYDYSFDYHFDNELETRQEVLSQLLQ